MRAEQVGSETAGQVFARRLKAVRKRKGWSQQKLSDRLAELGYPMHRVTLAKIEQGGTRARNVALEDVLALSAALDVSPLHMFIPLEDDARLAITTELITCPAVARRWVRGRGTLPETDIRFYFTELPPEEIAEAMAQVDRIRSPS